MQKNFKKLLSAILAAIMIMALVPAVSASSFADTIKNTTLDFNLTCDGENNVTKETGDIIDVYLTLENKSDADYYISTISDYIVYDHNFFEYVEGSAEQCEDLGLTVQHSEEYGHKFQIIFIGKLLEGTPYEADQQVITFKLKVIGTSGSSMIVSEKKGADFLGVPYQLTKTDLKVTIADTEEQEFYTLSFDSMGGNSLSSVKKAKGESVNLSVYTPVKQGLAFDGWYKDKNYSGEPVVEFTFTEDTTLYAKWKEPAVPKYKLSFVTNGGSTLNTIEEDRGTVVDLSDYVTTKSGYEFSGWYSDASLSSPVSEVTLDTNKTVYAKWTELDIVHDTHIQVATPKVDAPDPDYGVKKDDIEEVLTNNSSLNEALHEAVQKTDASPSKSKEKLETEGVNITGATITTIKVPYVKVKVVSAYDSPTDPKKDTVKYEIKGYYDVIATVVEDPEDNMDKLVYEGAGSKNSVYVARQQPLDVNVDEFDIIFPIPVFFDVEVGDTVYVIHEKDSGEKHSYDAKVQEDNNGIRAVKFTNKAGSFSTFTISPYDEAVARIEGQADHIGYFSLQEAIDAADDKDTIDILKNESLTVTMGRGKGLYFKNKTSANINIRLTAKNVSGYDFDGWSNGPAGKNQTLAVESGGKSAKIEADYVKKSGSTGGDIDISIGNKYDLEFETDGGSAVSTVRFPKNTVVDLSNYITRKDGYTFDGWYSDKGLTKKITSVKLTEDTVVYAKWIKKDDTVAPPVTTAPYKDVTTATAHYASIMYVTEHKIMNGTGDGTTFSPEMPITRGMIVTMLHRLEGTPAVTNAAIFPDTPDWCRDAIAWGNSVGIIKGYDNGLSGANDNINNEQLQLMLLRYATLKGYDVSAAGDNYLFYCSDYADISTWALAGVKWSVANKIVTGDALGNVYPKAYPTRAETAAYLHRFMTNVKPATTVTP